MDLFDEAVEAEPLTRTAAEQRQILDEWGLEATLNDEPEPALPTTDGADEEDETTRLANRLAQALHRPAVARTSNSVGVDPTAPPLGLQIRSVGSHGSVTISDPAGGNGTSGTYNYTIPPGQRTAGNITCPKCTSTFAPGDDIEVVSGVGLQHKGECPTRPAAGPAPTETTAQKAARLLAYADAVARGEQPEGPNPFSHVTASETDNELARAAQQHLAKSALKSYSPAERQQIIEEGSDGVVASNLDRLDISGTHYEALEATSSTAEDEDLTFLDGDPNLGDF